MLTIIIIVIIVCAVVKAVMPDNSSSSNMAVKKGVLNENNSLELHATRFSDKAELKRQINILETQTAIVTGKIRKNKKIINCLYIAMIAGCVVPLILMGVTDAVNAYIWFIGIALILICGIWAHFLERDNKHTYPQRLNQISTDTYSTYLRYFAGKYNTTCEQIEFDLQRITNLNINGWWTTSNKADVIENELDKFYVFSQNAIKRDTLTVENLQLQNESIKIDNNQKKFWTCAYCGNYNPGSEMSCIKCGAARRIAND